MLVRHKRLLLEERLNYVGPPQSLVYDTTLCNVFLQDGITPGGHPIADPVTIQGPSELSVGVENVFTIVDYDAFSHYELSILNGTVVRDGPTVIITVDDLVLPVILMIYRNGVGRHLELAVERDLGPGPTQLVGGDFTAGFFGETSVTDLITGDDLAAAIGLVVGVSQHSDVGWLKFALDDRILFVAKKPMRHSISWDHINAVNAVYGREGDAEVVIDDRRYRVRLLKGADEDPTGVANGTFNPVGTHLSEWSRLMYPVHSGVHTQSNNPVLPEMGTWAQYTDEDLLVHSSYGHGSQSWCQETRATNAGDRVTRGYQGITRFTFYASSFSNAVPGWRPCLELIS